MPLQPRSASSGNSTVAVTAVTPTLPTGWQPGDILVFGAQWGSTATLTFTQTGGTGNWALGGPDGNTSGTAFTTFTAWRVMQSGDTAPTFTASASGWVAWALVAITPDPGQAASVDKWAAVKKTGTAANAFTANSAVAAGAGEVSVLLTFPRRTANAAVTVSYTPPTGWAVPSGGSSFYGGSSTSRAILAAVSCQSGVSGTVAPGADSVTDGSAGTYQANTYQVLIIAAGVVAPPAHPPARRPAHRPPATAALTAAPTGPPAGGPVSVRRRPPAARPRRRGTPVMVAVPPPAAPPPRLAAATARRLLPRPRVPARPATVAAPAAAPALLLTPAAARIRRHTGQRRARSAPPPSGQPAATPPPARPRLRWWRRRPAAVNQILTPAGVVAVPQAPRGRPLARRMPPRRRSGPVSPGRPPSPATVAQAPRGRVVRRRGTHRHTSPLPPAMPPPPPPPVEAGMWRRWRLRAWRAIRSAAHTVSPVTVIFGTAAVSAGPAPAAMPGQAPPTTGTPGGSGAGAGPGAGRTDTVTAGAAPDESLTPGGWPP